MSDFQKWCKEILPIVQSVVNGEVIQGRFKGAQTWVDSMPDWECFAASQEYRIKPLTIKIGDFDVPGPMRVEPNAGDEYFVVEALSDTPAASQIWHGMDCEKRWLSMGLCHKSKESAIAHAKAIISLTAAK